jgi:hypothetical protein
MKPESAAVIVSGWACGRKINQQLIFTESGAFEKLGRPYSSLEMILKTIL